MIDISRHPNALRALALLDRGKAFIRRQERGGRKSERNLDAFYAHVWRDAAAALGGKIDELSHGVFDITIGDFHTRVIGNTCDLDTLTTHLVVRTKPATRKLLDRHGLPQTKYIPYSVDDMTPAIEFMEKLGGECVVKPAAGTGGGIGITTGVRTRWQLARASWAAARFGGDLTIEEQVEGENYRLLFLDGELIDAVQRCAPSVTGDGNSTILALVKAENDRRTERGMEISHTQLTIDMDMTRSLEKQNLSFSSVPAAGKVIKIKTAINENSANDNVTVMGQLSRATVKDAALAATVCGVRLAGVDLILKDLSLPLREGGGIILEVNSPPGYFWHYKKRDGSFPLGVVVLKQLMTDQRNGRGSIASNQSVQVQRDHSSWEVTDADVHL
jgi:D-alanine-D-alanine ligase-like ATP-grasp enzyme